MDPFRIKRSKREISRTRKEGYSPSTPFRAFARRTTSVRFRRWSLLRKGRTNRSFSRFSFPTTFVFRVASDPLPFARTYASLALERVTKPRIRFDQSCVRFDPYMNPWVDSQSTRFVPPSHEHRDIHTSLPLTRTKTGMKRGFLETLEPKNGGGRNVGLVSRPFPNEENPWNRKEETSLYHSFGS